MRSLWLLAALLVLAVTGCTNRGDGEVVDPIRPDPSQGLVEFTFDSRSYADAPGSVHALRRVDGGDGLGRFPRASSPEICAAKLLIAAQAAGIPAMIPFVMSGDASPVVVLQREDPHWVVTLSLACHVLILRRDGQGNTTEGPEPETVIVDSPPPAR